MVDVAGWRRWSVPLAWAGANALLIYLMHPLFQECMAALNWRWWEYFSEYYPVGGAYQSLCVTVAVTLLGAVLWRAGLRLRL